MTDALLPAAALEVVRVSASYEASPEAALVDVSVSVAPGEIVAVIGPNGAGKSTLLRVLAGTLRPTAGEVRLFGAALAARDRRDVARDIAFVAQSEEVRFAFSVREIVLMGRAPHQGGWMRHSSDDARIVDEVLDRCDLRHVADRPVDQLSGGEKKRVAIARAFAQSSRVLLLDEPTAFLDVRHQVALFEWLREGASVHGRAIVVVTHDLQLAAAHASRVLLMKGGRLVAQGLVDEVLTGERLAATFDWPIDVGRMEGAESRVFVPRRTAARAAG